MPSCWCGNTAICFTLRPPMGGFAVLLVWQYRHLLHPLVSDVGVCRLVGVAIPPSASPSGLRWAGSPSCWCGNTAICFTLQPPMSRFAVLLVWQYRHLLHPPASDWRVCRLVGVASPPSGSPSSLRWAAFSSCWCGNTAICFTLQPPMGGFAVLLVWQYHHLLHPPASDGRVL